MPERSFNIVTSLIVPVGTQVSTRDEVPPRGGRSSMSAWHGGRSAEVPADAIHSYLVRLPDGTAVRLRRSQFSIHHHRHEETLAATASSGLDEHGLG